MYRKTTIIKSINPIDKLESDPTSKDATRITNISLFYFI